MFSHFCLDGFHKKCSNSFKSPKCKNFPTRRLFLPHGRRKLRIKFSIGYHCNNSTVCTFLILIFIFINFVVFSMPKSMWTRLSITRDLKFSLTTFSTFKRGIQKDCLLNVSITQDSNNSFRIFKYNLGFLSII